MKSAPKDNNGSNLFWAQTCFPKLTSPVFKNHVTCAVIPCLTRAQAARIAKVANMTEWGRVEMVDKIVTHGINRWLAGDKDACSTLPSKLLAALGLATGGKA